MPDKYLNEVLISPGSPEVAAVVMMSLITRPRPAPPRNLRPVWSLVWAAAVWAARRCSLLQTLHGMDTLLTLCSTAAPGSTTLHAGSGANQCR